MPLLIVLNCFALCVFSIGTYFIWPNKKNIFNVFSVGFCIVGYMLPSIIFNFENFATKNIVQLYAYINILGATFFVLGLFIGYKWKHVLLLDAIVKFNFIEKEIGKPGFDNLIFKIATMIYIISIISMFFCIMVMGFVPMFAADPYMAKQFKGSYQISYQRVALIYRTAKQFIGILMPFILINFISNKDKKSLLLIIIGFFLIFIMMSRGETVAGIITIISMIVVLKKGNYFFFFYLIFIVIFFSFGSAFWSFLAFLFPSSGFNNFSESRSVFENIVYGAPDILDQLALLSAFISNKVSHTYGLTFLGGIVPYNFKWNPSVWTLTVSNQTSDISEISSGGLRVTPAMWGYFSFGWVGVCILPFISAFFTGYTIKKIKRIVQKIKPDFNGLIIFYFLFFIYSNIVSVFIDFYKISIYSLPAFVFYGIVLLYNKRRQSVIVKN